MAGLCYSVPLTVHQQICQTVTPTDTILCNSQQHWNDVPSLQTLITHYMMLQVELNFWCNLIYVWRTTTVVRSVTLKLQRGECSISAEQYDSSTVYFSDVSDFAELSSSHDPMQIVAILNEIYKYVGLPAIYVELLSYSIEVMKDLTNCNLQSGSNW